jgi:hypothetical protein
VHFVGSCFIGISQYTVQKRKFLESFTVIRLLLCGNKRQNSKEDNAKKFPVIGLFGRLCSWCGLSTPVTTGKLRQNFRKRNSCPKGLSLCPVHFTFVGHNLKVSHCHRLLRNKIYEKTYRHI